MTSGLGAALLPTSTSSSSTTSSTVRAIVPIVSKLSAANLIPVRLYLPNVGLKPKTPQNAAGRKTDPPVCVPKAAGTMKSATAAADESGDRALLLLGVARSAVLAAAVFARV